MDDEKISTIHHKSEGKRPIRVLLLDDREENLMLRATILRKRGYEVLTASSIEAAEQR